MNELKRLADLLFETRCNLEQLSSGEAGMLDEGTTAQDIAEFVLAVQDMAKFLEDELGERTLARASELEIECVVSGWLESASKVDARRGED
jgi:hypothetical protein